MFLSTGKLPNFYSSHLPVMIFLIPNRLLILSEIWYNQYMDVKYTLEIFDDDRFSLFDFLRVIFSTTYTIDKKSPDS